ncbi:hypothetical protein [Bradyrhizobium jicamae]|uniref:hypothetical protein n=1 Tax=Bradyrhizobium jicamae TaxID=280332 RepID=UPI001BAC20E2|nr:hypothetical protein [Bradyrhizobium jicamae]MBR0934869.1 hypothetical protein [Bradyrhizobium jicamae]
MSDTPIMPQSIREKIDASPYAAMMPRLVHLIRNGSSQQQSVALDVLCMMAATADRAIALTAQVDAALARIDELEAMCHAAMGRRQ